MGNVLLATDGSEYARRAADRAIDLTADRDATLYVLCVVDRQKFDEPALSSDELATIAAEDYARECLEEITDTATEAGVPVVSEHRHGTPHETILEYADAVDADVIVMGEHGEHGEHGGHLGGVGRTVAARADREVFVVGIDG